MPRPQSAAIRPLHIVKSPQATSPDETLAGLVRPTPPLRVISSALSAHEAFQADPTLYALAVVDDHGVPVGLINRFRCGSSTAPTPSRTATWG